MSPVVTTSRRAGRVRRGFTLVEILIVMVIIALLVGLLFAALGGGTKTANIARVVTEIGSLSNALEKFKVDYGSYPPSRITLYETGTAWAGTGAEQIRSRQILRGFWNDINFAINRDFNNDGDTSDVIELRGSECLAFFLGGMRRAGTGQPISARIGFSKNPADPFETSTTNRVGPFLEFVPDRIRESAVVAGMPVYFDALPGQVRPYLYVSAYDGAGYDRNTGSTANRDATTNGLASSLAGERLATFEYLQTSNGPSWRDKSFQIISPGFDGAFGQGGVWDENAADAALTGTRAPERDNITNFHGTTLATN